MHKQVVYNCGGTSTLTLIAWLQTCARFGEHAPKWQALATPTGANSTGQTVKQSWMENGLSTLTPNGYGTNIPDPRNDWLTLGFDQLATNGTTAIKTYNYNTNSFDPIANTGIPLYNKNGYFLFVRGDRSLVNFLDLPNPTNLRSKGALFQPHSGYTPPSVNIAGNGKFELIGNPYASAIDIAYMRTHGNFSNLTDHVIVWDPLIPGTQGLGGYQVLSAPNYTPTPGGTLGNTHYVTGVSYPEIQSGQAFFMQTSGSSTGTVTFDEGIKSVNSRVVTRGINATRYKSFKANLFSKTGICDGNAIFYDSMFSNDIDSDDAGRPFNPGENFMIRKNYNRLLTIESRANIKQVDSVFYAFKNLHKTKYRLVFAVENLAGEGLNATLIDNYLNKKTIISLTDSSFIDFNVMIIKIRMKIGLL